MLKVVRGRLILFGLTMAFVPNALSDEANVEQPENELTTVVTASGHLEPEWKATRMVDSIVQSEIAESNASSMADVLELSSGAFVQRTNRGAASPIIRGLIGPSNLIVIDGVPFNLSTFRTGPNQYMQLFDSAAVGVLELLRGPSSVLYGSGAMGGVIQIVPKKASRLGYSRTSGIQIRSADQGVVSNVDFSYGNRNRSYSLGASYELLGQLRSGQGFKEPISDYTKLHWRASIERNWESIDIETSYFGALIDGAGRSDRLGTGDLRFYDNIDHFSFARFRYSGEGVLQRAILTVNHHRLNEDVTRYNCHKETNVDGFDVVADFDRCANLSESALQRKRLYQDQVDSIGASLNFDLEPVSDRLTLVLGTEVYQDFVDSKKSEGNASSSFEMTPKSRGNFSNDSWFRTASAFLHSELELLRGDSFNVTANGGARFSSFEAFAPDVPELGDVSYSHSAPVYSAGLGLQFSDWISLYGVLAQGFRAPNLQETTVLADTGSKFEIPNDALRPERSNTYEIGLKIRKPHVAVTLVGFYTELVDVIDEIPSTYEGNSEIDGASVVQRSNEASGVTKGVEGQVRLTFGKSSLFAGATWLDGQITSASGDEHPMRRLPPGFGNVGLRYTHNSDLFGQLALNWALAQDQLHPSDRKDHRICQTEPYSGVIEPDCSGSPAWTRLNFDAGFKVSSQLRFVFSAHNLLDQQYRTHGSGFFAPGLDFRLTALMKY